MIYELWDSSTANLVGAYDSEAAALEVIGQALREHGATYVTSLVLGQEDDDGESVLIATGNDLVRRVEAFVATREIATAAGSRRT